MAKKPVIPESLPPDPNIQKILDLLMTRASVPTPKAPPTDPRIAEILAIVTDNNQRLVALAQNLGFLTDLVNVGNEKILDEVEEIEGKVTEILRIVEQLAAPFAQSLTISFGETMANTVTMVVGQSVQATAHEWSGLAGAGVELKLAGPIAWSSSDATIATVDPASGMVTAVGPGQATITGSDPAAGTGGLSGQGIVSDTPVVAQSLTVDFGTPA